MLDVLRNNIKTLISAIEDCRDRKQILPCITLIYCGIDIVASLEKNKGEGTASAFQRWTNNYLLPEKIFGCSSKDLYGARCGVVHTFSSASDYSRIGKARQIIYAWGKASANDLQRIAKTIKRNDIVIHLDELITSYKNGVNNFFSELSKDPERVKMVTNNAGLWFTNMDISKVKNALNIFDNLPDT